MNNSPVVAESFRQTFTVDGNQGDFAPESIKFGVLPPGLREQPGIGGVTVLVESGPADAITELWLPRVLLSNP